MKNPRRRGGHRGLVTSLSLGGFLPEQFLPHDLHGGRSLDPDAAVIPAESFNRDPDDDSIRRREPNPFLEFPS